MATLVILAGSLPVAITRAEGLDHLLISEIATGGLGANDEFIELFNPSTGPLPLGGLEIAYASASGASVSQRVSWPADSAAVPPGGHVLIANEAGVHAAHADVLYQGGLAEAGGTVILRALGATTAIDAVAWGTAAGSWLEGRAAPAPPPGSSLQRLSGADGLMQDTADSAADFAVVAVPTPEAAGAPAPTAMPSAMATVTPSVTPSPTASSAPTPGATLPASPSPAPSATAVPAAATISIAAARGLPNGSVVTVVGAALTGSAFSDGGGYIADETGGVAVIVEDGSFEAGSRLVVTGEIDDRFSQRTIRARGADVLALGAPSPIQPLAVLTGSIAEAIEGRLVRITGTLRAGPTALSAGLAYEVDDGSGSARAVVASATGIDTTAWVTGTLVELVGVVGQRDSSGSGSSGYRLLPRMSADVLRTTPPATPPPSQAPSGSAAATPPPPEPSPTASQAAARVTPIAAARSAAIGTRHTVRGVVTLPPGVLDSETALIQDETGAIVIRLGEGVRGVRLGDLVEVDGIRSTKAGMETLRASTAPLVLGAGREPEPVRVAAVDVSEPIEGLLVALSGDVLASARRAASGTVTFDVADGSGLVRVVIPASLRADDAALVAGASVDVVGVVGQETTAAEPLAGYRIWPRSAAEVRLVASPDEAAQAPAAAARIRAVDDPVRGSHGAAAEGSAGSLDALGTVGLADLRIGATLVAGRWAELGVAGVLWDGTRLVAISPESTSALAALGEMRPPVSLALGGLRVIGVEPRSGALLVLLGGAVGDVAVAPGQPAAPRTTLPGPGGPPAWVTLVGRVVAGDGLALEVGYETVALDLLCADSIRVPDGVLSVTGIGVADPPRVIVPCDGVRAAPTLARSTMAAGSHPGRDSGRGAPARGELDTVSSATSLDTRRTLAAWLLTLGVAVVSAAAVIWRRLARIPRPDEQEPAAGETDVPDVPNLTLVRLRRDEGS